MIRGDTTYRLISDHLGSVRLVVNAETGAIAQRLDYDAFGRVLRDTNPGFQPYRRGAPASGALGGRGGGILRSLGNRRRDLAVESVLVASPER
jgi:YD repeat-containing protein